MGVRWTSGRLPRYFRWPHMAFRGPSDGHQNTQDGPWIASDEPQNTSLGSDRHQMSFVDGFELEKAATGTQIVNPTVHLFMFLRGTSNGHQMAFGQPSNVDQLDLK